MISLRSTTLSVTYSLGQIILGLLLHPFQTTQSLIRDKYWLAMIFFPLFVLLAAFILWQGLWIIIFRFFSATPDYFVPFLGVALELVKWWFFYFFLIWQIMLILLFVKFQLFFYKKKNSL